MTKAGVWRCPEGDPEDRDQPEAERVLGPIAEQLMDLNVVIEYHGGNMWGIDLHLSPDPPFSRTRREFCGDRAGPRSGSDGR
jgi:hypothetical protein